MIDCQVYFSKWPTRHLPDDTPARLAARLERFGVRQAWVGSFDGLLHKDMAAANARLAEACRKASSVEWVPIGTVNPTLPDWQEDLRRCQQEHQMPGIRLFPGYHDYRLDDERFRRLLRMAAERGMAVQLVVKMEDERTQHPMLRAKPVDVTGLETLVRQTRGLKLMVLNGANRGLRPEAIDRLAQTGQVLFDIAMLEGVGGVRKLVDQIGHDRIVFGSLAPLFYFEAAWLKLKESPLSGVQRRAILQDNAHRWLSSYRKSS